MTLSLNEVEATSKKATRGAGYSWGLAEDAGRAARWLCAQGVDGCAALQTVLDAAAGQDLISMTPVIDGASWVAPGAFACPIIAGAALSDRAHDLGDVRIGAVISPLFLAPFAAMAAAALATPIDVRWQDGAGWTDGAALRREGDAGRAVSDVFVSVAPSEFGTLQAPATRAAPSAATWARLEEFAAKTYAPATEASRLKGAGAGLADTD